MWEIRLVMLPDGRIENIRIDGSRIVGVDGYSQTKNWIDGRGLLALPGLIDPHVHFRVPGGEQKEDWVWGSRAALRGGVTTVFDMPNTNPALITAQGVEQKSLLVGEPGVDFRFWFGATAENRNEIRKIAHDPRVIGAKVYMGSSTGNLLVTEERDLRRIFSACAEHGLIVGVHAEDEALICKKRARLGHEPVVADHCIIRDTEVEVKAVKRALRLQKETEVQLYFCHLSTPQAVELVSNVKEKGRAVYIEVCPHHLWLTAGRLWGSSGALFKMNPPLRSERQVELLRKYVCQPGMIDMIGSDHAPHTQDEKLRRSYDETPSGVPGVQTLFSLLFSLVSTGQMSLCHFVELTSTNAAKIFGLRGKGRITLGFDADLVLVDPDQRVTFHNEDMASKCGWTPYEGMSARGAPRLVIARGEVVKW